MFPRITFVNNGPDLTMFQTNEIMGREILVLINFCEVESQFGLFKFVSAEHWDGSTNTNTWCAQKQFSAKMVMVREIVDKVLMYLPSNDDYLQKALKSI